MKKVLIQVDQESEMYSITVGGKVVDGGNFWDFSFPDSLENILEASGVTVDVEEYTYEY